MPAETYKPCESGVRVLSATQVNIVSAAINAALVTAGIVTTVVPRIVILVPGHREISGQHLQRMGSAMAALGRTNPLPAYLPTGERLHDGAYLNAMAKGMGLY